MRLWVTKGYRGVGRKGSTGRLSTILLRSLRES